MWWAATVNRASARPRLSTGSPQAAAIDVAICDYPTMVLPPELRWFSDQQDGLITRQQALSLGMTPAAVRHALRAGGPWQRVIPGVYAMFTGRLVNRQRLQACLLHAGPEAVVTGSTACEGYGMRYVPASPIIELLVPPHVRRSPIPEAAIHRTRSMPVARVVHGVPFAPPERAALDAVRGAHDLRTARAALCEVVQRGLASVERLAAEYAAVDKRGLRLARAALQDVRAGCRSAPECELRDLIRQSNVIDEPVWNGQLPGSPDIVPDAYFEKARVVLEVDSVEWHRLGEAPELTERRRARYASLGWRVIPLSPRRIRAEPDAVLSEIEQAVTGRQRLRSA